MSIKSAHMAQSNVLKSTLLILHVDCLELIISLLPAYDVGNLWLTGSLRLRKALSIGGAVRKLHYTFETSYPLLWPSLIASLPRLVDISITVDLSHRLQKDFYIEMASLPHSLENLTLDFCNSLTLFKRAYVADPTRFYKLKKLWIMMYTDETVDLDLSPLRELTSLKVKSENSNPHYDDNTSVLIVPPNLTALSVVISDNNLMQLIPRLPATLTYLSLRSNMFWKDWKPLPSGLIHFKHTYANNRDTPEMDTLPKNLQTLSLQSDRFGISEASQLPRSLTSLSIYLNNHISVSPELFAALPPNLTFLSEDLLPDIIDDEAAAMLPRRLQCPLSRVTTNSLTALPTGIRRLSLGGLTDFPCPPEIVSLRYLTYLSCDSISLQIFSLLPSTLETLRIDNCQKEDISASIALQLPPYLTSLWVLPAFILEEAIEHLPRTLKSLTCRFERGTNLTLRCPLLPPNLTVLHIIAEFASFELMTSLIQHAPTLSSLTIKSGSDLAWAAALPSFRYLKELTIKSDHIKFSNARVMLQSLPKRIQTFEWHSRYTDLVAEDLACLPQSITSVNIDSAPKVDEELVTLPRFVSEFYFGKT